MLDGMLNGMLTSYFYYENVGIDFINQSTALFTMGLALCFHTSSYFLDPFKVYSLLDFILSIAMAIYHYDMLLVIVPSLVFKCYYLHVLLTVRAHSQPWFQVIDAMEDNEEKDEEFEKRPARPKMNRYQEFHISFSIDGVTIFELHL